jgi:hypothetical protein
MTEPQQSSNSLTNCNRVKIRVRFRMTLRLAVYRQSVRAGAEPHEGNDQRYFSTEHLQS